MNEAGWSGDLAPVLGRVAELTTGASSLRVLAAGSRLSLALPKDREASQMVIDLYRPQRWKGRLFQWLARVLVFGGVASRWPSFRGEAMQPTVDWLESAARAGSVGFLGCNPVHGWRCVLAGVLPDDGTKFVAKLGLGESAASIRRESGVLDSIHGRFPGVIESAGLDVAGGDPDVGKDWALLRLPYLVGGSPESMEDSKVVSLLNGWLEEGMVNLGEESWTRSLLDRIPTASAPAGWHQRMRMMTVRRALVHGDFAVWNLRAVGGGLTAIDWEWAVERGVGGIDLAHGLRQEAVMVHGLAADRAVDWILQRANGGDWVGYLESAGWKGNSEDWLRLGLMHSHYHTKNDSADLLKVLGITVLSYA